MSAPLLQVENLTVVYPGRRRGLRSTAAPSVVDVSLEVAAGETLGLVGESGAGKSTIGRAVLGLVRSTSGRILVDGVELRGSARSRRTVSRHTVQAVFQDPNASLNPARTVGASLCEPLRIHRGLRAGSARNAAAALCERVSLPAETLDRLPHQLSGGQRQRVAIARALASEPRLIVCDEPVTALDVSTQAQVVNLLADLQAQTGIAFLFISHDLAVVRHLAHRVGVMSAGRLVETGSTASVCLAPTHPYTQGLLAAVPVADPVRQRARRDERRRIAAT